MVRFRVEKDGSISDIKTVKDPGYGIGSKMEQLMKESPKWQPAYENGQPVTSYHTQPITLVISKQ
jgi:protein TonB